MNNSIIAGFEFKNFRSIGATPVSVKPLKKVNILIGQNNSGKSNVARAIQSALEAMSRKGINIEETDIHLRGNNQFEFKVFFHPHFIEDSKLNKYFTDNQLWFEFTHAKNSVNAVVTKSSFESIKDLQILFSIANKYLGVKWNNHVSIPEIQRYFHDHNEALVNQFYQTTPVEVFYIPEFRQIREGSSYTHDGQDLIRLLAEYKSPRIGQEANLIKFRKIEKFTRELLHLPHVTIDVPSPHDMIILQDGDLRLPLSNFGTGTHELIILVTAVTEIENSICCIEEPEIHLHPRLQSEFVKYLLNETNNVYFLTTHSATLINMAQQEKDIQIFHLSQINGETQCFLANSSITQRKVIDELGIKPSDLFQANCIIWVEGAADRIYIRRWLELLAPELVEDFHYKFLYYANTHRFIDEALETEFESLLKINKNIILIQDSDKSSAFETLSEKKTRLERICIEHGGISWITEGREIENYLSSSIINNAWKIRIDFTMYDEIEKKLSEKFSKRGQGAKIGKVDIAKRITPCLTTRDIKGDLKKHLLEIIEKIRIWNM